MKPTRYPIKLLVLFLFACSLFFACSKPAYIPVTYSPPAQSYLMKGKRVFLNVKDLRSDDAIFGENAKKEFEYFTGLFSLSIAKGKKDTVLIGAFELSALFAEALKLRIENIGAEVVSEPKENEPVIEIELTKFFLDLESHKWKADISYEARLIQDNKIRATQNISGQAERVKVIGSGAAEKVLSDMFTEIVNKFNIHNLYVQSGLI